MTWGCLFAEAEHAWHCWEPVEPRFLPTLEEVHQGTQVQYSNCEYWLVSITRQIISIIILAQFYLCKMGLIMPSFPGSEIVVVFQNATVKMTLECYFIPVKCYSENINRKLYGEINLFQMLHRTYCHGEDISKLFLFLAHRNCLSRTR